MPAPRIDTTRPDWKRQAEFSRPCKACKATLYFIRSQSSDKLIPYNEQGISHFEDCPEANSFSASKADTRKCAVGTCGEQISKGKLMCLWHWRKVDRATQEEIIRTWQDGDRAAWAAAVRRAVEQAEPKKAKQPEKQKPATIFDMSGYGVD